MTKATHSNLLRFPGVDVVEASAGSGKTYALAKRYIQLAMDPQLGSGEGVLKSILAITFTNKAAMEMKERILEFLKKIALDAFDNREEKKDIISVLPVSEGEAREIAHSLMDDIIRHYNLFQVQTIDSFVNALLSGFAFDLPLSSAPRIREDYRAYLERSLDSLTDRLDKNKAVRKAFQDFLTYYLFVENNEGWFSKREIVELMVSLYNCTNTYGGTFSKPTVEAKDLQKKRQMIVDLIKDISNKAPEETDGRFMKSLSGFAAGNNTGFDITKLPKYFGREEFPVKKGAKVPENVATMWTGLRTHLGELCEWESHAIFKPYIEIFALVLDELGKLAKDDDAIFLQELNARANSLVGGAAADVPEIYYRLGTRLRHFLIDEFQDTSRLQWENIVPMVEEALSSGGSLFYVGDKKQAIFRFRGGDVSLFDSVRDDFRRYGPQQAVLTKNYRSQKEIVLFNSEIFSPENLRRFINEAGSSEKGSPEFSDADIHRVLKVFSDSKQEWKEKNKYGFVKVEAVDAGNKDERNAIMQEKLISLIKELRKRFSFGDIAILARDNDDVELCTAWLIGEDIPVESRKTLSIREHHLIKELISFLKFLNSPIDNVSFASFISGSIFQKVKSIKPEAVRDFLFELGHERGKGSVIYLYREFRQRFPDVWEDLIEEFFKSVGFVPLYEFVTTILGKFRVVENFPDYQGFFMKFLELIKENEKNYTGISSFLGFLEDIEQKELYVNVTHEDSVKVTTIHDAKGLEFSIVIIPFLEMKVKIGGGRGGGRKSYIVRQEGKDLTLVKLKKGYGLYSEKLGSQYRDEYVKSLIDELDALYVALTRAGYEMYLFIPSKAEGSNNIARVFVPSGIERGTRKEYEKEDSGRETPVMKLPASRYSDWIEILKDEFVEPSQLINRDSVLRGEVLHCILSCVGNLYPDGKDACLRAGKEKASLSFPYVKDVDKYMPVVEKLVEDKKLKPIFYVKEGAVYQEKEVVDSHGDTRRIDRLVVTPEEVWVIDYKSSKDESGAYEKQIREYVDIAKSIYPQLNPKGFLVYLDTLSVEEVHG